MKLTLLVHKRLQCDHMPGGRRSESEDIFTDGKGTVPRPL